MSDAIDQGITVTEIAAMDLPINVAPETTAAFVGRALRGPLNTPVLISSFIAFQRRFGGSWSLSGLGPAVKLFFDHGGKNLFVVRVANNARGAMLALPASGGVLVLHALEPGTTEIIRAAIDYDGIPLVDNEHFNLVLQRIDPDSGLVADQEIFNRLSCIENSRSFIGQALLGSSLARVQLPPPQGRPAATVNIGNGFEATYVGHAQLGTDGGALSDYDLIGSSTRDSGIFALNQIEHFDLLYFPPPVDGHDPGPALMLAAEQYCCQRGAMLIMDPPAAWSDVTKAVNGVRNSGYTSSNMLSYYPRARVRGDNAPQVVGGALAGLLCKLDRTRGPWEELDQLGLHLGRKIQPALELTLNDAQLLVRAGLNVIAGNVAGSAMVCGSVTLGRGSQIDRTFSRLTVRRLCLKITNAIGRATQWSVFAHDKTQVAERIHGQVDGFLSHLANSGAFADNRFVVQCEPGRVGRVTDSERGVTILLAFCPAGTDEEIALTLHQTVAGCRVALTAFAPVRAEVA